MVFYTYVLQSEKNSQLYIGQTNDLEDRIKRHNENRNLATKGKGPWKILFSKQFETRVEAVELESKLKSWKSRIRVLEFIARQAAD